MAKTIDFGGSAFPVFDNQCEGQAYRCADPGMTFRDWLAGQALAGSASFSEAHPVSGEYLAEWCYKVADAMIAERSKRYE